MHTCFPGVHPKLVLLYAKVNAVYKSPQCVLQSPLAVCALFIQNWNFSLYVCSIGVFK